MKKKLALLLIVFLVIPLAYSATKFVIDETEKIAIAPKADDPDSDYISIEYSSPLNENGEWQTTYGDAGTYNSMVTVSDGQISTSKDILIVVKRKEAAPSVDSFLPRQDSIAINESQSVDFSVIASDANKDELTYRWYFDNKKVAEGNEYTYDSTYNDEGTHRIKSVVSDGKLETSKEWPVEVKNVDVQGILDEIKDVAANENELVKIEIPDFEKYGLAYTISKPFNNNNEWQTTYDDSGIYDIKVHAEGKGFSGSKTVVVTVNDIDRPAEFAELSNPVVNEGDEIKITFKVSDPDGDKINFEAKNLPEGSLLDGNVFTWTPDYDTIQKNSFFNKLLGKFRILGKSFYPQFIAVSNKNQVVQNVIITVVDKNRAPVIEPMDTIIAKEDEFVTLEPRAYDLDGDKVTLQFSGYISTAAFRPTYDDSGDHEITITASDGTEQASIKVPVNVANSNRAPALDKLSDIVAYENDEIAMLLNAKDPDGDNVKYYLENPPQGVNIKDNAFIWKPAYSVLSKGQKQVYNLVFSATDGSLDSKQIMKLELRDKNRAPRIANATISVTARLNKPASMSVVAVDDDNDQLDYTWDFGFFDKYKGTQKHQRIFTTRGTKQVKVIVSDGIDKTEQMINVNVV
ncbi:MAG: hypothetical protein AABX00_02000 [Nanoarchaeota archaeon]